MKNAIPLFLDTEFTGLHRQAQLISLALYREEDQYFYAEFAGVGLDGLNPWLQEQVVSKLNYRQQPRFYEAAGGTTRMKDSPEAIATALQNWLQAFDSIEIWADVPAYDWVFFCELFGGALNLPPNIFYAPFDLATALRLHGHIHPVGQYSGDVSRYALAGLDAARQHHALEDCRAEKACFDKMVKTFPAL